MQLLIKILQQCHFHDNLTAEQSHSGSSARWWVDVVWEKLLQRRSAAAFCIYLPLGGGEFLLRDACVRPKASACVEELLIVRAEHLFTYVLFQLEKKQARLDAKKKTSGVSFGTKFYSVCRFTKFSNSYYLSPISLSYSTDELFKYLSMYLHKRLQGSLSLPYKALWF